MSFYEVNDDGKITSARDIPEPTIKPGDSAIYVRMSLYFASSSEALAYFATSCIQLCQCGTVPELLHKYCTHVLKLHMLLCTGHGWLLVQRRGSQRCCVMV